MSFSASINLGTVGVGITGKTVSISGCTGADCTSCTSLVTGQAVSSFPKTLTGIADGVKSLFVKVDNGDCAATVQCITIAGIPEPTAIPPTPIPPTPIPPTPIPPTAIPPTAIPPTAIVPTAGPTYYYYRLRPCEFQGQTGYLNGDYDVWSTPYISGTFNSGDRVEGGTGYYYVVNGSQTTDPGGSDKRQVTATGLVGCPELPPGPTLRTIQVYAWSTASGPTLNDIKTDACGKYPYQLPAGYTSVGTAYVDGSTFGPGQTYTLWNANAGGQVVNGGNKYHAVLWSNAGQQFTYVAYITTAGIIQDWTECSAPPAPAPIDFTITPACVGYAPTGVTITVSDPTGGSGTGYSVTMTSPEGFDTGAYSLPHTYTGLDNYVGNTYAFSVTDSDGGPTNKVLTEAFSCAAAPNNTATVGLVVSSTKPSSSQCSGASTYQVDLGSPSATFCTASTFTGSGFTGLTTGNNYWLCYDGQTRQVFHPSGAGYFQQAGSCQTL